MPQGHWQMPQWWYRKKRPSNDSEYLENMTRVIFQAGLNWHVIDLKWPATKKAFANFNISKVASFDEADVSALMKNDGIVRNRAKIEATLYNAKGFRVLEQTFGSFRSYLDSLDKSNNYAIVIKDLCSKFKRLAPSSASLFLYTVGEEIQPWD